MVLRYWRSRAAGGTVLPGPHPGWPLSPAYPAVHAGYTRTAAGQVSGLGWEEEGFEERELARSQSSDPYSHVGGCGFWTPIGPSLSSGLPLVNCVVWDELLYVSDPQFSHISNDGGFPCFPVR